MARTPKRKTPTTTDPVQIVQGLGGVISPDMATCVICGPSCRCADIGFGSPEYFARTALTNAGGQLYPPHDGLLARVPLADSGEQDPGPDECAECWEPITGDVFVRASGATLCAPCAFDDGHDGDKSEPDTP